MLVYLHVVYGPNQADKHQGHQFNTKIDLFVFKKNNYEQLIHWNRFNFELQESQVDEAKIQRNLQKLISTLQIYSSTKSYMIFFEFPWSKTSLDHPDSSIKCPTKHLVNHQKIQASFRAHTVDVRAESIASDLAEEQLNQLQSEWVDAKLHESQSGSSWDLNAGVESILQQNEVIRNKLSQNTTQAQSRSRSRSATPSKSGNQTTDSTRADCKPKHKLNQSQNKLLTKSRSKSSVRTSKRFKPPRKLLNSRSRLPTKSKIPVNIQQCLQLVCNNNNEWEHFVTEQQRQFEKYAVQKRKNRNSTDNSKSTASQRRHQSTDNATLQSILNEPNQFDLKRKVCFGHRVELINV